MPSSVLFRTNAGKFGPFCAAGSFPVPPPRRPSAAQITKETSTSARCARGCCEYQLPAGSSASPAHPQHVLSSQSREPTLRRLHAIKLLSLASQTSLLLFSKPVNPVELPSSSHGGESPQSKEQMQSEDLHRLICFHKWCFLRMERAGP